MKCCYDDVKPSFVLFLCCAEINHVVFHLRPEGRCPAAVLAQATVERNAVVMVCCQMLSHCSRRPTTRRRQ